MKTVRTRKSAGERKEQIVDAAIRLAGEIGPDRITTEILAKEVGISQPGIFRHFPTKGDIWWAVAQRIGGLMRRQVGGLMQKKAGLAEGEESGPAEKLHKQVIGQLRFIETTPAIPAILFSRELHVENEKMRCFFAGLIASRQRKFSTLIAMEIAEGQFRKTLNPDDAAYLILALIQGLAMRWSLNAREFDLVVEGRRLLDLLLDSFRENTD